MQQNALGQSISSACPSEQQWGNFLQGAIAQLMLDSMSEHLNACSQCSKVVDVLATPSNTVQKVVSSPYLQEFNYLRMVARLEEVQVASGAGDTVVEGKPRETLEVDAPIPETIGRFVVRSVLGTGGFGRVYLADDPLLNRSVAIKAPRRSELGSDGDISSFLSEARHAAALDHPGIVPIFDVLADDSGRTLIVMKYIDGKPLKSLLNKGPLELPETIRILIQVARAVHFAHERGFVHRDLKPSNILIDRKGVPHVCDLGLGLNLSQQNMDLQRAGTPEYMSPEQVRHDIRNKIDRRSDIWSLGVMLAELVHGRRPFPQSERRELFHAIEFEEPLIESTPETKSMDLIIRRCLAKLPEDRYATAELLADDLALWLRRNFPTGLDKYRYGWRRNVLVATFCALLFGVAVIGLAQMKRSQLRFNLSQLESAPVNQVPKLIARLKANRATASSISGFGLSSDSAGQFRLDVASLAVGERSQATLKRCVDAIQMTEPEEIAAVAEALRNCEASIELSSEIAGRFTRSEFNEAKLRLSAALAGIDPQNLAWQWIPQPVALKLVSLTDDDQLRWLPLFDPVGKLHLAVPLQSLMNDESLDSQGQLAAAHALARFLSSDVRQLATAIGDADSQELRELVDGLKVNVEESKRQVKQLFDAQFGLNQAVPNTDLALPTDRDFQVSRFAVASWLLGAYDPCLDVLQPNPDPTLQTLVIHGLAQQDIEAKEVIEVLNRTRGDDARARAIQYGLLQVLGELKTGVSARESNAVLQDLLNRLFKSPDSGVHSMVRLIATRYGINLDQLQPGIYGQWLVDSIGDSVQDFSIIEPCVVSVGIQGGQQPPAGATSWPSHRRRFLHRIAVATNEVTIEQFRLFDRTYIDDLISLNDLMLTESASDAAMMTLTIEAARRFCNSWSNAAGFDCCYEPKTDELGETKLEPKENFCMLNGYRLPTDGEWEMVCRAGSETSRYFGNASEPIAQYAWTWERKSLFALSPNRTVILSQRVSQLLPNRWGLFDMYGNATELCELGVAPTDSHIEVLDDLEKGPGMGPGWPLIRGASLTMPGVDYGHSHCRSNIIGGTYGREFGMRVVRTLSDSGINQAKR